MSINLIASNGNLYTNGKVYGNEIYLSVDDDVVNWFEIPEAVIEELTEPKATPISTFDSSTLKIVENVNDDKWDLDFVIYAKLTEPKATLIQAGILYSDYYCYEDELVIENEDVLKLASSNATNNEGYAIAVRGLSEYDECYFRPYAIYELEGKEVVAYGNILMNELFYQKIVNMPMTLELTDEDYIEMEQSSASSLREWIIANGYGNAGITTYYVEE